MDLHAAESGAIPPGENKLVKLGFEIALPTGVYARIAPRSGLALKHSIQVDAGVIDRDYRGEVKVLLRNSGLTSFNFANGDRVAQLILEKVSEMNLVKVDQLFSTSRNGGFGSTGIAAE